MFDQTAKSNGTRAYGRPPSCKSSKKGSSKDGSLLDAVENGKVMCLKSASKKMTLNELAMLKKTSNISKKDNASCKSSNRSNSRKKEGCLMQYFHSDSSQHSSP
jgi:hypothetical protein